MTEENIIFYEARHRSFIMVPETCPLMLAAQRDIANICISHIKTIHKEQLPSDFREELLEKMDAVFCDLKSDTTIRLRTALIESITENIRLKAMLDKGKIVNDSEPDEKIPVCIRLSFINTIAWATLGIILQFIVSLVILPITLMILAFDKWETRNERRYTPY